jgi:arylsulfatase A-like enzyme
VDGRLIDIVPLFIIGEGFKVILHEPVSFLSIAPTMIDVAGVKAKIRTKGVSLIRGTEKSIYHMGEYVPAYKIKEGLNFYLPSEVK